MIIQAPKQNMRNYEHLAASLTGEFNQTQQEQGRSTVSSFSVSSWLKQHRSKHALYLHKLDYCDTCAGLRNEVQELETQLKRLMQFGSASEAVCGEIQKKRGNNIPQ